MENYFLFTIAICGLLAIANTGYTQGIGVHQVNGVAAETPFTGGPVVPTVNSPLYMGANPDIS
ncbi:MAG TPA: hypothetical protein VN578_12630 [Candidatus Binatia bacterium]|jgi:hypothetical protein|nr:hypothetical protein [Candidatus Binatia bacterium]